MRQGRVSAHHPPSRSVLGARTIMTTGTAKIQFFCSQERVSGGGGGGASSAFSPSLPGGRLAASGLAGSPGAAARLCTSAPAAVVGEGAAPSAHGTPLVAGC
jgi:hypothetical protein